MVAIVAAAAAAAAAIAAGVVAVGSRGDESSSGAERPSSVPPLLVDLGVRDDAEARALRRGAFAYAEGRRTEAARIFGARHSLEAQVGAAMAAWPGDSDARLRALEEAHPRSALVLLHRGVVSAWEDRLPEARQLWRRALRVEPDSLSAIRAEDFLYVGRYAPGRPAYTPGTPLPTAIRSLPRARQLAALEAGAETDPAVGLLYGSALQQLGRPVSALAAYRRAAAAATGDLRVEAQVAEAVARFTKAEPERAFASLGPLARSQSRSATVRFHLGLLLAWIGDAENAKQQLRLAAAANPPTRAAKEAKRLLDRLESDGTG